MYRFFQHHGKKILAVFSAFLMISFALTGYYGRSGGGGQNPVVGKVGDEKIYNQEVRSARQAWDILNKLHDPEDRYARPVTLMLGPDAVEQITAHPVLFFLLQKEAQHMGVTYNEDFLNNVINNTPWLETGDPDRNDDIRRAMAQLLLVRSALIRAASPVKVSAPMIDHELAELAQTINLNVAEFTTAQYKDRVPAPTAEQLKAHFEKFADVIRGPGDDSNPFGFGYKYPDRLKLQYIGLRRDDVRKAVQAAKEPYQWEVEAQKFYLQHQSSFVRRDAQTRPATTRAATSAPTTAPFAEVREQIKDQLINAAADRKVVEVLERITTTLAPDWTAYHNAAGAATRPVTAPSTSVGAAYDSFEYLQKLAQRVQQQTGVLPIVVSIADRWLTEPGIAALPGLSEASIEQIPLPQYLMNRSAGFISPDKRNEPGVLAEMQPTRSAYDANGNVYIARVSTADPAHRPATLTEVENDLRNDVVMAKSYELAKAEAQKVLNDAQSAGSLKSAAVGRSVVSVGPLTLTQSGKSIPGVALSGAAADRFLRESFKLVSTATSKPGAKPVRLVELPKDGRLFVTELGDVQALWNDQSLPMAQFQASQALRGELAGRFHREWFNYDNVTSRLKYAVQDASAEQ